MSNQPAQPRPWFRLPSVVRPAAPTPTPTPAPPPPQPRPAIARPVFRPVALPQPVPTQPQEPTPAPPPPSATVPPPVSAPPPETVPPASGVASVPTSPALRAAGGAASLPTSPVPKRPAPSSSVPTSPVPTSTVLRSITSSLPTSPTPKPAPTSSSVPTSPPTKPAPSGSIPTSPASKPVTVTSPLPKSVTTSADRVPSPGPSLRTTKPAAETPPQSPKAKPNAPPPSPLTLPPSQVKSGADIEPKIPLVAEQKTVLVQKTIDKSKGARDSYRDFTDSLSSGIARLAKQESSKGVRTKERGNHKKYSSSDSEDAGMRVITIAGENKGAFMEVIRSPKKNISEGNSHNLHRKQGNPRGDGSDWGSQSSSGEEGSSKKKDMNNKKGKAAIGPSPLSTAFMNSNVQGVNNSIVYNSSCSHHDPGVHVALTRKPAAGAAGFHVKDRGN